MRRVPCGVTHLRKSRPCAGAFSHPKSHSEATRRDPVIGHKRRTSSLFVRRPYFCVRSTPLRRLGGGFCGTYNPVPGVSQNAPIHLAEHGEWIRTFLFSKLLIHTHPKARHSRFLHIERYSFIQRLSIEKRIFYKKFQKLAIFITLKMFSKNLGTKSSISTKKHPFFTFSLRFFSKHTKKTPNRNVWSKKIRANPRPALTRKTKL